MPESHVQLHHFQALAGSGNRAARLKTALSADGLQVDQDMFCRMMDGQRFEATGELRLLGVHIGVVLSFEGASLRNDNGPALNADGLQVDQDLG